MVYFRVISLLFLALQANAQTPNRFALDSLADKARRYMNAQQTDSLYALMGQGFKREIPADQFQAVIANLRAQLGEWKRNVFRDYKGASIRYRALFANAPMDFYISQDSTGRIETFLFRNYEPNLPAVLPTVANNNPLRTRLDIKVDSLTRLFFAQNKMVGVSIGLLRNDSLFVYGYGETAKGGQTPPTADNLFEIGSISKTFTATLLADLVLRGRLKLDDPVNKYLPDSIPPLQKDGKPITLLSLSNHTSGLPRLPGNLSLTNPANPYKSYDRTALFAFLKQAQVMSTPGEKLLYSNLGVGLLGTVLELRARQDYEALLNERLTKPLGMVNTIISVDDAHKSLSVQGHDAMGNPVSSWEFQALAGAGAIRSSVNDMVRYLKANLGTPPKSVSKAIQLTQQTTFEDGPRAIGLGWFRDKNGLFNHNGGTGGFTSFVGFNPDQKIGIVILSNAQNRVELLAEKLLELIEPK